MNQQPPSCTSQDDLTLLLEERLDDDQETAVLQHLDRCDACRQALEVLASGTVHVEDFQLHLSCEDRAADKTTHATLTMLRQCLAPSDDPRMLGRIGIYEVCGLMGRGSTGIVVKAYEPHLNRYVAIKILSPSIADNAAVRARFAREGRAVAAVTDLHVVPVHSVSNQQGLPYLVMHYVSGGSLQQRLDKQGQLSTREVVRIGMQVARGLAAAHAQGIVHRDVKPSNILLEQDTERALVTDFGLAQASDDGSMTGTGFIAGTPQYMSPEQARGERLEPRSDLFSLGSLLYAACTGHPPFRSASAFGVIKKVCDAKPVPIREENSEVAPWLAAFIGRLMEKRPHDRFESASEVADLLERELAWLQSPVADREPDRHWYKPPLSRSRRLGLVFLMILVASCAAIFGWTTFLTGLWSTPAWLAATDLPWQQSELVQSIDVQSGGKLFLRSDLADIEIKSGDVEQCHVEVKREIRAATDEIAAHDFARHQVSFECEGDGRVAGRDAAINLYWNDIGKGQLPSDSLRVAVTITIPRKFDLDVETQHGDIRLSDVQGQVRVKTGRGTVDLGSADGSVVAICNNGRVLGKTVSGDLNARVENGSIRIGKVDGDAQLEAPRGSITIEAARGVAFLETRSGDIWAGRMLGGLHATSDSGTVTVEQADEFATISTSTGDIEVSIATQPSQTCTLQSHDGDVTVNLFRTAVVRRLGRTVSGTVNIPNFLDRVSNDAARPPTVTIVAVSATGKVSFRPLNPPKKH